MNTCYKFKIYNYKNGLFDKSVDATYIIYTEGNTERYDNILNQLYKIKPTKIVYILHNKGWRKCLKDKYVTNTAKDLIDCNINIFKHAKKKNYDNILILEDDYIFDDKINNKNIINNINNFLLSKKDKSFSFYFGTLPFIFIPYNLNINKGIFNIYTHSVIFSKKYRKKVLNYNYKNINCWDLFQNYFNYNKYYYNIPLIYQIIEKTENSNNWYYVNKYITKLWFYLAHIFDCKNNPNILFSLIYILSYIITLFIFFIILFTISKIWKKLI
jgi:hypothetical protein